MSVGPVTLLARSPSGPAGGCVFPLAQTVVPFWPSPRGIFTVHTYGGTSPAEALDERRTLTARSVHREEVPRGDLALDEDLALIGDGDQRDQTHPPGSRSATTGAADLATGQVAGLQHRPPNSAGAGQVRHPQNWQDPTVGAERGTPSAAPLTAPSPHPSRHHDPNLESVPNKCSNTAVDHTFPMSSALATGHTPQVMGQAPQTLPPRSPESQSRPSRGRGAAPLRPSLQHPGIVHLDRRQ